MDKTKIELAAVALIEMMADIEPGDRQKIMEIVYRYIGKEA